MSAAGQNGCARRGHDAKSVYRRPKLQALGRIRPALLGSPPPPPDSPGTPRALRRRD